MKELLRLHNLIAQVCPVESVRLLTTASNPEIIFKEEATPAQREVAQAIAALGEWRTTPNWDGFLSDVPSEILAAISASPLASLIISRWARLADNPEQWTGEGDRLLSAWNAAPPALSEADRATINALAETHALPIHIEASNEIALN